MIGDLVISIVYWFVNVIVTSLPVSSGFPPEAMTAVTLIGGYIGMFSSVISVPTIFSCLSILIGAELAIFGFRTFKWVLSHLPFIGGHG